MPRPKVLIADDDADLLRILSTRLGAAGYDVICTQDSYQALQQARRETPNLIVLDVNMPAGDGFTVQERLRKMPELSSVPVIYLTGERSSRVASHSRALGACSVVQKPFEMDHLLAAMRSALSRASSRERALQVDESV